VSIGNRSLHSDCDDQVAFVAFQHATINVALECPILAIGYMTYKRTKILYDSTCPLREATSYQLNVHFIKLIFYSKSSETSLELDKIT
jgi:hypothetical protein